MIKQNSSIVERGFTIVELLVSTVIFSLILTGATAGIVQIGRLFYKGVATAQTQETARSVIDDISQSIQFSKRKVNLPAASPAGPELANIAGGGGDTNYFCIGPVRYTYAVDRKLSFNPDTAATEPNPVIRRKEKRHVMWVDEPAGGCSDVTPAPGPADLTLANPCSNAAVCTNGRELLSENMRISRLEISNSNELYNISLSLAYGEDNDSGSNRGGGLKTVAGRRVCEGTGSSVNFCAIAELSSSVVRRLQ